MATIPHRERAIPAPSSEPSTRGYRTVPVDLDAPQSREKLVDLRAFGIAGESYYHRGDGLNAPYYRRFAAAIPKLLARESIATRLCQVNNTLRSCDLEVFVLDAFRPIECQLELWAFYSDKANEQLPEGSELDRLALAERYCSNPSRFDVRDSQTWPTHVTGGAVDVTLRRKATGEHLFMGGVFDDPAEHAKTAYFEVTGSRNGSEYDARANRRTLYWSMIDVGFANYPGEWWHFDFGTQMWVTNAMLTGHSPAARATYGPATNLL